jgi:hypothetical protein
MAENSHIVIFNDGINYVDEHGCTTLMNVINQDYNKFIHTLLRIDKKLLNVKNNKGESAFALACKSHDYQTLGYMVQEGCVIDPLGLWFAQIRSNTDAMKYLIDHLPTSELTKHYPDRNYMNIAEYVHYNSYMCRLLLQDKLTADEMNLAGVRASLLKDDFDSEFDFRVEQLSDITLINSYPKPLMVDTIELKNFQLMKKISDLPIDYDAVFQGMTVRQKLNDLHQDMVIKLQTKHTPLSYKRYKKLLDIVEDIINRMP